MICIFRSCECNGFMAHIQTCRNDEALVSCDCDRSQLLCSILCWIIRDAPQLRVKPRSDGFASLLLSAAFLHLSRLQSRSDLISFFISFFMHWFLSGAHYVYLCINQSGSHIWTLISLYHCRCVSRLICCQTLSDLCVISVPLMTPNELQNCWFWHLFVENVQNSPSWCWCGL